MSAIYRSPFPEPILPKQSIFHYLFPSQNNELPYPLPSPDTVSFIEAATDRCITRGQLESQAKKLASGLRSLGLKRGDVACIFGTNSLEWINAMLGCQAAGVRVTPANFAYTPKELYHQLRDSQAELIFLQPNSLQTLFQAIEGDSKLSSKFSRDRIVLLCQKSEKGQGEREFKVVEELWGEEGEVERFENGDENETAFLCYSSGTVCYGEKKMEFTIAKNVNLCVVDWTGQRRRDYASQYDFPSTGRQYRLSNLKERQGQNTRNITLRTYIREALILSLIGNVLTLVCRA